MFYTIHITSFKNVESAVKKLYTHRLSHYLEVRNMGFNSTNQKRGRGLHTLLIILYMPIKIVTPFKNQTDQFPCTSGSWIIIGAVELLTQILTN